MDVWRIGFIFSNTNIGILFGVHIFDCVCMYFYPDLYVFACIFTLIYNYYICRGFNQHK